MACSPAGGFVVDGSIDQVWMGSILLGFASHCSLVTLTGRLGTDEIAHEGLYFPESMSHGVWVQLVAWGEGALGLAA